MLEAIPKCGLLLWRGVRFQRKLENQLHVAAWNGWRWINSKETIVNRKQTFETLRLFTIKNKRSFQLHRPGTRINWQHVCIITASSENSEVSSFPSAIRPKRKWVIPVIFLPFSYIALFTIANITDKIHPFLLFLGFIVYLFYFFLPYQLYPVAINTSRSNNL